MRTVLFFALLVGCSSPAQRQVTDVAAEIADAYCAAKDACGETTPGCRDSVAVGLCFKMEGFYADCTGLEFRGSDDAVDACIDALQAPGAACGFSRTPECDAVFE